MPTGSNRSVENVAAAPLLYHRWPSYSSHTPAVAVGRSSDWTIVRGRARSALPAVPIANVSGTGTLVPGGPAGSGDGSRLALAAIEASSVRSLVPAALM